MNSSAQLVRTARTRTGLTQAQLAHRLGVSQAAIARLEDPMSNATLATLERALHATGHRLRLSAEPFEPSIDETLIERQLRLTPAQRLRSFESIYRSARELALAGARARGELA